MYEFLQRQKNDKLLLLPSFCMAPFSHSLTTLTRLFSSSRLTPTAMVSIGGDDFFEWKNTNRVSNIFCVLALFSALSVLERP